ncbi:MAG: transketolase [Robiginitomaculum sp.]|nr:MAG: transketolase [Robiginitomaculum sp.]
MTASHKDMANAIRALSMDAVQRANSGHPGMPMGMADVASVLFSKFLKFDAKDPDWADRDRFVLSAGHGSMLLYSLLYLTGTKGWSLEDLKDFRTLGSKTAGHPEYGHAPGIETTTGPLGQGLATAVGMALAEKMLSARYGDDLVDHTTYVIVGDGCLMEGVSHEAAGLAARHDLSRLIVLWDDNDITIDGSTDISTCEDTCARFTAYGWSVRRVDGHDPDAIEAAIAAEQQSDRPSLIACKTVIGFGSPNKGGTSGAHGAPLGDEEIALVREKLGWPYAPFEIPTDVLESWRAIGERGGVTREDWMVRLELSPKSECFVQEIAGTLPEGFDDTVNQIKRDFVADSKKVATRITSKMTLDRLTVKVPAMLGGSADLTGSNGTLATGMRLVTPEDASGNYIEYGVREFGMAAAMNGMALHGGFIPYGGTFLVFADYMRPAIRLSALMGARVIYVMTHDSIGLGEDGPTHQPVETLASLRAIPNVHVFRPADGVETAECWALALKADKTPSIMSLTRQGLVPIRGEHTDENLCAKGAYVVFEPEIGRDVTLLATGSEVEIAVAASDVLAKDGIRAAVVSMPCFELFAAQGPAYRAKVLGRAPRIGIEAAVEQGWERWLGENGIFIGMDGFGASAPAPDLYKHFGITAKAMADAAKTLISKE